MSRRRNEVAKIMITNAAIPYGPILRYFSLILFQSSIALVTHFACRSDHVTCWINLLPLPGEGALQIHRHSTGRSGFANYTWFAEKSRDSPPDCRPRL